MGIQKNLKVNIITKKKLRLMRNVISTLQNKNFESKFKTLAYNHYTKCFKKMFKDFDIKVVYKTKHTPKN